MQVTLSFKEGATQADIIAQFNAVFAPVAGSGVPALPTIDIPGNVHFTAHNEIATPYPTLHVDDNPSAGAPSAAEVFGQVPNVAPASAGAAQLPTAHVAPISNLTIPGSIPPAPPAGPAVVVQPANAIPSNPAGGVELDADGLPHDARIHSSNHEKTQKNVWRKKRGVSDMLVAQVEAELKRTVALPMPGVSAVVAPPSGLPGVPPVVAAAPEPVPPFAEFMVWLSGAISSGQISEQKVNMQAKLWGLVDATGEGSITLLAHKPVEWIKGFRDALGAPPAGAL